ncbi:MAG: succinylglutamate desuccinylase/aspartoacylase family protein [Magnetococcales bacterium]|nr:succinylglutamate desuccinylase/aspartoacylase family protein [Magnetococcales bacterium]
MRDRDPLRKNRPFVLGDTEVPPGHQATVRIPIANLYTHTPIELTVHVNHGYWSGPCLFVSGAIHGDELNGVEICRRLQTERTVRHPRGTLLTIPVVNVLGFLHQSRYFPDHRDLNRTFPGLAKGSLAAQTAELFMRQIVARATHGIDLHSGTRQRFNLPQTRGKADCPVVDGMARAFGAPVHLHAGFLDGSLRAAAHEAGVHVLLFEGGEALRLDEEVIRSGIRGIIGVMRHLGMLPDAEKSPPAPWAPASSSSWVRAPGSGLLLPLKRIGALVREGELLGRIHNPLGSEHIELTATRSGVIIGCANHPLVNQGDALFHIAFLPDAAALEALHEGLNDEFL